MTQSTCTPQLVFKFKFQNTSTCTCRADFKNTCTCIHIKKRLLERFETMHGSLADIGLTKTIHKVAMMRVHACIWLMRMTVDSALRVRAGRGLMSMVHLGEV